MMQFIDTAITALFFVCSAVIYLNVAALWRDRAIKGISIYPMIVFFVVDCLQAIRFFNEGSFALATGATSMCLASAAWLGLAAFFALKRGSLANIQPE